MTTNTYRILIGANGWLHPAWQTTFYPDDLPNDWQLGYYSNEFPIAMMPAAYWQYPDEQIKAWLEDSADSLLLLCEVPPECLQGSVAENVQAMKRFVQRTSILAEHCAGLLISIDKEQIDMAGLLEQIPLELPVCIDLSPELSEDYVKSIQKVCEKQGGGVVLAWQGTTEWINAWAIGSDKNKQQGHGYASTKAYSGDCVESNFTSTNQSHYCRW